MQYAIDSLSITMIVLYLDIRNVDIVLYIHGSVHRESNCITLQQDATVFSLLHICRQLYMFQVLTPETCRAVYRCVIN